MHVVPSGAVMLASWREERLARFLSRPLERYTPRSVVDPGAIRSRLDQVRADGYCWMEEEFAEGINSVGAPVYEADDRVIGAIHVHGPAYRFPSPGNDASVARLVKEAAERVSATV